LNTTQEATVDSPRVWLTSKHSRRAGGWFQAQRLAERGELLGESRGPRDPELERLAGVLRRHLQPAGPRGAHPVAHCNLAGALLRQRCGQQRLVFQRQGREDLGGRVAAEIVLRHESAQHLGQLGSRRSARGNQARLPRIRPPRMNIPATQYSPPCSKAASASASTAPASPPTAASWMAARRPIWSR
jgi:hypothetical protein